MDEGYYEEVSDQEEEVSVVAPIPVVAVAPQNVEVQEFPDNPESPSPEPSPASPGGPSPAASPPGSPVGGVTSFIGFFIHDDLAELEQWTVDSRAARADPTVGPKSPMFHQSENFPSLYIRDAVWGQTNPRNWRSFHRTAQSVFTWL